MALIGAACTSIDDNSLDGDALDRGSLSETTDDAATGVGDEAETRADANQAAPPEMTLAAYYREIVGTSDELADCLAAAAGAESLQTVADLQAAEANAELVERLAAGQDACIE